MSQILLESAVREFVQQDGGVWKSHLTFIPLYFSTIFKDKWLHIVMSSQSNILFLTDIYLECAFSLVHLLEFW